MAPRLEPAFVTGGDHAAHASAENFAPAWHPLSRQEMLMMAIQLHRLRALKQQPVAPRNEES